MKLLKLLLLLCLMHSVYSSAQTIEWGAVDKESAAPDLIWDEGGSFYTNSYVKTALYTNLAEFTLARYENMTKVAEGKIQRKLETGKGGVFGNFCLNGKLVVVLMQTEKTSESFYYQLYDKTCKAIGEPVLIAEFQLEDSKRDRGYFTYELSQNKKFLLVEYLKKGRKGEQDNLMFKVFNSEFSLIQEGEYQTAENLNNSVLTNEGEYVIGVATNKKNEKGKEINQLESYQIKFFKGGQENEFTVDLSDKAHANFKIYNTNSNQLVLLGNFYDERSKKNGYCFSILDLAKNKETKWVYCNPNLDAKNEYIREVSLDNEGSLIVLVEQFFEKWIQSSNGNNSTSYSYETAYVFKMKEDGNAEWVVKLPKRQYSINDGGIAGSLMGYSLNNTYYLFFNDDLRNYASTGEFLNPKEVEVCGNRKGKTGFVKVEIDLKSGEFKRELMLKPDVQPLFVIPFYCEVNYDRNEMLVFFRDRKEEQYGVMKF
ncbi:hypothetical protein [Fluviicola chungangensis]|uniref:Uncharacterized protein n=1 Tax=Fluviicola chungangensis TaxID=2597671 RepID=A0A556N100_9FLAO|nr:hypothetical protein [Fluviicola chungangensis]TSJ45857.1 hypothetical protein FO442_08915 [Fluviicola chungangensis]